MPGQGISSLKPLRSHWMRLSSPPSRPQMWMTKCCRVCRASSKSAWQNPICGHSWRHTEARVATEGSTARKQDGRKANLTQQIPEPVRVFFASQRCAQRFSVDVFADEQREVGSLLSFCHCIRHWSGTDLGSLSLYMTGLLTTTGRTTRVRPHVCVQRQVQSTTMVLHVVPAVVSLRQFESQGWVAPRRCLMPSPCSSSSRQFLCEAASVLGMGCETRFVFTSGSPVLAISSLRDRLRPLRHPALSATYPQSSSGRARKRLLPAYFLQLLRSLVGMKRGTRFVLLCIMMVQLLTATFKIQSPSTHRTSGR